MSSNASNLVGNIMIGLVLICLIFTVGYCGMKQMEYEHQEKMEKVKTQQVIK